MNDEFTKLVRQRPELKYEPYVRQQLKKEGNQRMSASMNTMNQYPMKSGWIFLLQNRVNLQSIGNRQWMTKVYYDRQTHKVGPSPTECNIHFRAARLKNGQPAAGWIESID